MGSLHSGKERVRRHRKEMNATVTELLARLERVHGGICDCLSTLRHQHKQHQHDRPSPLAQELSPPQPPPVPPALARSEAAKPGYSLWYIAAWSMLLVAVGALGRFVEDWGG